ncbi:MAG TPA: hypothetical protein VFK37_00030 [Bacillales bacterium]|nr:hypothetical protein [Bacillales bacterium]
MRRKSADETKEEERVTEWMKQIQVTPTEQAKEKSLHNSLEELKKSRKRMRRGLWMKKGLGAGLVAVAAMIALVLFLPQLNGEDSQNMVPNQGGQIGNEQQGEPPAKQTDDEQSSEQGNKKQDQDSSNPDKETDKADKDQKTDETDKDQNTDQSNKDQGVEHSSGMTADDFAPSENIVKYFAGEGSEFAQYKEEVYARQGNLLAKVVHSGANQLIVYRITDQKISIVYQHTPFQEEQLDDLEKLANQGQKEEVVLALPLEKGEAFGQWKVIETNATVKVPFGQVEDVTIVERKDDNGNITLKYWAKDYGVIKTENMMNTGDGGTITVTSSLEKVENRK